MNEYQGKTPAEAAVASVLDVVEELVRGLAAGQTPEQEWADLVGDVFAQHRLALAVRQ